MIPFKGRSLLRQYLPKKPKKWGFKLWGRCDASGFLHDFNVYQGKGTGIEADGADGCGLGGNVVLQLCSSLERDRGYKIFADNYFSNFNLAVEMKNRGFQYTGTVNKNRLHNAPLESDKDLAKRGRGSYDTVTLKEGNLALLKWQDNKTVTMMSTYLSAEPLTKVKRYDRAQKARIEVDRPAVITVYNKNMGGVDLLDMMCTLYKRQIKGRRWYLYIFYHTLTICVVNSWFLYKRDCQINGVGKALPLKVFQSQIAEVLTKKGKPARPVGRPSLNSPPPAKQRAYAAAPQPDVRYDNYDHFPMAQPKRNRCRYCPNGYTQWKCGKCNVFLCLSPGAEPRNCFLAYHKK
ncbi:piggyBac transposable element-derived protein 3-like [Liolophura sinensis]|uniref:piggyBac transposable element-derived protein 3-like n=1 Tax=Liolophura sinensis TaxID=3198878 RepID=UPI0031584C1B